MKRNLLLAASMVICTSAFVGCSNEENLSTFNEFTVKATMQVESRTVLGDDHSTITWSKNDKIYLFGENSNATLQLINGAETCNGVFMGAVNGSSANLDKGFYPVPNIKGEEYSFDLPTERTYSANSAAPMFGSYSNNLIEFNNLVALVRVPLAASADERLLKLKMDGIAGKLVVDVETGKASINEDAMDEVTVSVPAGDACYIDIPVPAKEYSGYTVLLGEKLLAEKRENFSLIENDVLVILTEPGKDENGEFVIANSADLLWVAKQVNSGNTFKGITLKVVNDIDLKNVKTNGDSFTPVGDYKNSGEIAKFEGTLDGQGHTISNLYQSGWDFGYEWGRYGTLGLFSYLNDATIKNLNIEGFEGQIEGGDIAFIAGSATGDCVFENITITNSKIGTYNNGIGSIIGWSGAGNYTFKNITIGSDVVLGGLWGSFDSSVGGMVGQAEPGASYNFENVVINCRLDVYNDCTASYDYYLYRMCGMIIGRCEETTTIDGKNYPDLSKYNITCSNVTVNYGDWMNYHYCEPTPGLNNGRGMRVEPGYAYGGLPKDFDHSQCTTNHNTCIPFDGLFGGAQYGVRPIEEYSGVTVNYPASYIKE